MNDTGSNCPIVDLDPGLDKDLDLDLGAAIKTVKVNCIATPSWVQQVNRAR